MENEVDIDNQAKSQLEELLGSIPFIQRIEINRELQQAAGVGADFITSFQVSNRRIALVCEAKTLLQPRMVLEAVREVREHCGNMHSIETFPVIASGYISSRSAEILTEQNVSYFDMTGKCRLCFANIYIEKSGNKPKGRKGRGIKSLFGLKSSRMLRLLLNHPNQTWHVKELASKTELSLGQVSNIRRALLDHQYAEESKKSGIQLSRPKALLASWAPIYKKNVADLHQGFYSLLDSEERVEATKKAIEEAKYKNAKIMLSGLSAARWQAPYAKSASESFYADKEGVELLKKYLKLEVSRIGPNVIIEEPKDPFIFNEGVECAPGLECSGPIQTYLDLYIAGEREREAAEHIESYLLKKKWGSEKWGKV